MQWFGNLRVGSKLTVLVVAVLLIFLLTSVMAFVSLTSINDNVDTMYQWMLIPIVRIEDAVSRYLDLNRLVLELEVDSQAADLQGQASGHITAVQETINKYLTDYALYKDASSAAMLTQAGKADLLSLEEESVRWLAANLEPLRQAVDNVFRTQDLQSWKRSGEPLLNQGRAHLEQLVSINLEAAAVLHVDSSAEYTQTRNSLLIGVSAATLLSILIAAGITRSIIKPLKGIHELAGKISSGDHTATADVDRSDELGQMAQALDQAVEHLRETMTAVLRLADDVLRASQDLSASAEEVSASIEEVASTTNEFSSTVDIMNKNTRHVSEFTKGIASTASASSEDMGAAVNRIEQLGTIMNELAGSMRELHDKSKEIGNIVDLITDVADQTNLLALNAAIEAARAGEHGRGFAVVAEEVRKLAEQTAGATADITVLVSDIQRQAQAVMTKTDAGAADVDHSSGLIRESWERLDTILKAIDTIAKDIEQLAAGTEQIGSGSEGIAAATEEQSASIEQVAASAQNLSQTAEELQRSIAYFKVR